MGGSSGSGRAFSPSAPKLTDGDFFQNFPLGNMWNWHCSPLNQANLAITT